MNNTLGSRFSNLFGENFNVNVKERKIPSVEEIAEYQEYFKRFKFETQYVAAILYYVKIQNLEINTMNLRSIHSQLNYKSIEKDILFRFYLENPTTDQEIDALKNKLKKGGYKPIEVEIGACHYYLDQKRVLGVTIPTSNLKKIIDDLKVDAKTENLIAIKQLVNELEANYLRLLKLDQQFLKQLVQTRPLIVLIMLQNKELNRILIKEYIHDLVKYIENEDVYKQLVPFIQIHIGKTHGQWRHLADPSKTCIVLKTKNCIIASSKNTQKSFDKSESEGKFLVLQGLSIQADSENAEVHYLEV